jgi:hypothetical protein
VWQVQIDVPQVVHCYAAQLDGSLAHVICSLRTKKRRDEPFIVGVRQAPVNLGCSGIIRMLLVKVKLCADL